MLLHFPLTLGLVCVSWPASLWLRPVAAVHVDSGPTAPAGLGPVDDDKSIDTTLGQKDMALSSSSSASSASAADRAALTLQDITTSSFIELPLSLDSLYYADLDMNGSSSHSYSLVVDTTFSQLLLFDSSVPSCSRAATTTTNKLPSMLSSDCMPDDTTSLDLTDHGLPVSPISDAAFNSSLLDGRWVAGEYYSGNISLPLTYFTKAASLKSKSASKSSSRWSSSLADYTITNISFALANSSSMRWPGILGLAVSPKSSSSSSSSESSSSSDSGSESSSESDTLPSFWDQLATHALATSSMYSLSSSNNYTRGSLLFGAVDASRLASQLSVFPMVPIEFAPSAAAAGAADTSGFYPYSFPAVVLTDISVGTPKGLSSTNQTTSAYSQQTGNLSVILDTGNMLSYLPYDQIIPLATQTGAYYSQDLQMWIQDCSLALSELVITFHFFGASVDVPMSQMVLPLYNQSSSSPLYQRDGSPICALAIMDSDTMGYSALGASVLSSMYLVVDYSSLLVGIGQVATPWEPRIKSPVILKRNTNMWSRLLRRLLRRADPASPHVKTTLVVKTVKSPAVDHTATASMSPTLTVTVLPALISTIVPHSSPTPTFYPVRHNLTDLPIAHFTPLGQDHAVTVSPPTGPINTMGNNLPLFALNDSQISQALYAANHYDGNPDPTASATGLFPLEPSGSRAVHSSASSCHSHLSLSLNIVFPSIIAAFYFILFM